MKTRREILKYGVTAWLSAIWGNSSAQSDNAGEISVHPKKLVFVHGRGQEDKDPSELESQWIESLRRGARKLGRDIPENIDIAFPFYGKVLDDFAKRLDLPLTVDIQARGGNFNSDFLAFQADFAEELRVRAGVTEEQINLEFGDRPGERAPQNWEWVQAIIRALDRHTRVSQKTLEIFMRDVYLYTRRIGVRDEIDRIVANEITEEPTVVVGHSLGSVVTYSVLRSDRRALNVPFYLTLGSPLGVRSIRNVFRPLRFPNHVSSWHNAFDERDVVALYPLDQNNFPIFPAIENSSNVNNHTDNRHGIVGYLEDKSVARLILDALG